MVIKVKEIYAFPGEMEDSNEVLEQRLNELGASRIVSVKPVDDYSYQVIYEV